MESSNPPHLLLRRLSLAALLVQIPILAVVAFGDFGFYFPGAMGSYQHFVTWVLFAVITLLFGLMTGVGSSSWGLVGSHLAVFVMAVGVVLCFK